MRLLPARPALCALLGASILSCSDSPTSVKARSLGPSFDAATALVPKPQLVISQIYGGGGNSGATLKNDFVEIFNPGSQPVDLDGWSIQYASLSGSFTQVTPLVRKTIPPGGYYLVQEAAGSGGTTALPTPDATGSIAMSATGAKVVLVHGTSALNVACPTAGTFVDFVIYGSSSCTGVKGAAGLSNTTAAARDTAGCAFSGDASVDFVAAAPTPRNMASAVHVCAGALPVGPLDHLALSGPSTIIVGTSVRITATAQDANNQTVTEATIDSWKSSDESIATVDAAGNVTALEGSATPVTISATATQASITKRGSLQITVTAPAIKWIDISSSSTSFPPGFQTQLFATARTASGGTVVDANFKFETIDPDVAAIASVANTGIVTGVGTPNGTARPRLRIIATPKIDNGTPPDTFVTTSITIEAPSPAPTSIYAKNDEFGDPTPAGSDPNDLLIQRPQYTLSYNVSRGTPNWVAYELDARQIVAGQDRCNCFSADPSLPVDKQILTSDYTNGGYDRGHMARSFDRTAGNTDNASTFYLTNIVPQQADLNQGVWAQFENALGDSATKGGRAVYIITGPLYSRSHGLTYLKNEGKVAIPDSTWKVALIGPRNGGNPFTHGDVQSWDDLANLTILAVNMPNVAGVRSDPWSKYVTTVAAIERATGYDFLTLLATAFRGALEVNDHQPVARSSINGASLEGSTLTFDASSSSDPDVGRTDLGRAEGLTYRWQLSDGATATGSSASHSFAKYGTYTATLTVTDAFGWPSVAVQTLNIGDVAPSVAPLPGASLIAGESYDATGTFADPGVETWTATVNYGDGVSGALPLAGKSFTLGHTYASAGRFSLTVSVTDDGGAMGSAIASVNVVTPFAATQGLAQQLQLLAESGAVTPQEVRPLLASLDAASKQIQRGDDSSASNQLGAFANKLNAEVISGRMSADAAQQMTAMVVRIQRVLHG